jgi:hypothetical protein
VKGITASIGKSKYILMQTRLYNESTRLKIELTDGFWWNSAMSNFKIICPTL